MLPESIRYARSYLFTPATDPRKFLKGELGADVVVLDLEDSVALTNKINARKNLINFFPLKNLLSPRFELIT
ncbi:aldolase/citrate lyase family protein [Coxiella burnetii]|uniref:aldolase/citrate lyase family protein n=1 Tax=Coxiella burnetii TaxID=777 RepID=UPI002155E8F5|nr:aldolase/citrate lyase family protein [Coxiella burnetii]